MKQFQKNLKICAAFIFMSAAGVFQAQAQSKIFNMPSTEIVAPGKLEIALVSKFKPYDEEAKKKFSSFVPRMTYGLRKNIEIGFDVIGNNQPGTDNTTLIQTVKWKFYENEKNKTSVVMGNSLHIPLRHKKYNLGDYFYVAGSKVLSTGTKLTAGSYFFTKNVVAKNAARGGGQFGLEQKINAKLGVAAEWYTGKHSYGYLTTGFKVKLSKRLGGKFGYSVGNQKAAQGNHYFYASMAIKIK